MPVASSLLLLALALLVCCPAGAQSRADLSVPPHEWAVLAAAEEVHDLEPYKVFLRYRVHLVDKRGDQTRDLIESRDGAVARLIARNGRPLTAEEDQAEQQRLKDMLEDPASFAKHVKNEQTGKKQAIEVIRAIPDAMIFTYAPQQPQPPGAGADAPQVVLDFHPNPKWSAPTMVSETLTGLEGRLWIDARSHHITRLEAQVFRPVNVGFGVFAKVFPGGTAVLDEARPTAQRWLPGHFVEHVTLRAMMVKTIKENADTENSDFAQVPAMSYQEAVKLLLQQQLPR